MLTMVVLMNRLVDICIAFPRDMYSNITFRSMIPNYFAHTQDDEMFDTYEEDLKFAEKALYASDNSDNDEEAGEVRYSDFFEGPPGSEDEGDDDSDEDDNDDDEEGSDMSDNESIDEQVSWHCHGWSLSIYCAIVSDT